MTWIELRALQQLRSTGEVSINDTLDKSSVFKYLINSLEILEKMSRKIIALEGYSAFYDAQYLPAYERYCAFLIEKNFLKPQTRFELKDIDILMQISEGMDNGNLYELRDQIIEADESLRGVSLMFFKNEKYLLGKPSLIDALKQILKVDHFSIEKDQQYIYKLECHNPKAIILCENLDFLTKPNKPREYGVELWYAGGKNIQKLHFSDTRGLKIYYSCDWDYDGLCIYAMIKNIIPEITLLNPNGLPRDIIQTEHNSCWKERESPNLLSGLSSDLFDITQQNMIRKLILNNQWIIEESNDLKLMLKQASLESRQS